MEESIPDGFISSHGVILETYHRALYYVAFKGISGGQDSIGLRGNRYSVLVIAVPS